MRRIGNYTEAREYFKNTKAVRGENQSVRRLGDRYEKEKWLRQEIQDGVEVYVAGYYNTDLVRYYPTHKEITLGGYPSLSTQYFVGYMGNVNLHQFEHKQYVPSPFTRSPMVKNNHIEAYVYLSSEHYYMNANDWYAINYNNTPRNPEQFEKPVKYKFDASQMRELRKPFKELLKYIDTILKLNNNTGVENDKELDDKVRAYGNNILDLLVDDGNRYLAMYFLCRRTQRWEYFRNSNSVPRVNIGQIKRYADKMIKLENPQVLVEVSNVK